MSDASSALRILIVTQDFPPVAGGIQSFIFELAQHFHVRGHHVHVVCPGERNTASPLPPEVEVTRIRIHTSWLFLPLMFRLPRILRKGRYDVVLYAQWQGYLAQTFVPRSIKTYLTICPAYGRELLTSVLKPFHGLLCRAVFRSIRIATPISVPVEALLRRVAPPGGKVALIHPGVDPTRFTPGPGDILRARYGVGDAPVILAISRLVHRKGHDLLIKALPLVRAQVPNVRLILGGTGPEEAALRALARESELNPTSPHIIFAGRIADSEMVDHYRMATVCALPSRQGPRDVEGFGIVCLEANACEVPVVASDTGGITDAVADGETGILVPQENVEALAGALIRLLKDPALASRMGKRGRARVLEGLTWQATGDRYLDLMRKE